jgi:hypothetical protein
MAREPTGSLTPPARRGRGGGWLVIVILVLAGAAAAWSWVTLNWSYSEGERAGVLQKFSRRGFYRSGSRHRRPDEP